MLRFTMLTNSTIGRYLIGRTMNRPVEHSLDNCYRNKYCFGYIHPVSKELLSPCCDLSTMKVTMVTVENKTHLHLHGMQKPDVKQVVTITFMKIVIIQDIQSFGGTQKKDNLAQKLGRASRGRRRHDFLGSKESALKKEKMLSQSSNKKSYVTCKC